jgi:hypothetical protein
VSFGRIISGLLPFDAITVRVLMSWVRGVLPAFLASVALQAAAQEPKPLEIRHQPPGCLVPGRFPILRAQVSPIANVLRARVLFRTDPAAEPHVVVMEQDGQEFVATLPRPTASLARVRYWLEATDPALRETATDEHEVPVQATCANPAPARMKAQAEVTAPLGAPPVPAGFDAESAVAEAAPREGTSRAGVFHIGPWTSLGAAVAVGAAAVAVVASQNRGGNPPPRERQMEPPGINFIESRPAPGSTMRTREILHFVVRVVTPNTLTASVSIELLQGPGGPACATLLGGIQVLEAFFGRNVALETQPAPTGACGSSFEVTVVRVRLTDFGGRTLYGTGTAEIPDLPLRYTFTP